MTCKKNTNQKILDKPLVIITCALSGTGKSYYAKHLAKEFNATIFSSDQARKEIQNIGLTENRNEGYSSKTYSEDNRMQVYLQLLKFATQKIEQNNNCIIDATFIKEKFRKLFIDLKNTANIIILHIYASDNRIKKQIEQRSKSINNLSDANYDIYLNQKNDVDPFTDKEKDFLLSYDIEIPDEINLMIKDIKEKIN